MPALASLRVWSYVSRLWVGREKGRKAEKEGERNKRNF